jgi:tRNA threonylcarbamoyladenosine biosynthesis protein TsaB
MHVLAIELSTDVGSLAFLDAERVLMEREWRETCRQRQQFFAVLQATVAEGAMDLAEVDLFAVGVGPGAFTGLRAAAAAAQALALPGGKRMCGISSSEALARDVFERAAVEAVLVIGDARRDRLWVAAYERAAPWPRLKTSWTLTDYDKMGRQWDRPRTAWVSPDWDRIGDRLRPMGGQADVIEGRGIPRARDIGILARRKVAAGTAAEPVAPIYVHPPVVAAPRC